MREEMGSLGSGFNHGRSDSGDGEAIHGIHGSWGSGFNHDGAEAEMAKQWTLIDTNEGGRLGFLGWIWGELWVRVFR